MILSNFNEKLTNLIALIYVLHPGFHEHLQK